MKLQSKADLIIERLRKEGRVQEIEMTPEQIMEWEEQMRKVREEYMIKSHQSWLNAKDILLD
jgi:hypothetical protein